MDIREIRFIREGETFALMSGDRQVERYNAAEVLELGRLAFAGLADLQNKSRPSAAGLDVVRYEPVDDNLPFIVTPIEPHRRPMQMHVGWRDGVWYVLNADGVAVSNVGHLRASSACNELRTFIEAEMAQERG